ncbi:Vicilin-like seed storage protein-like protein [Drosera capensis]
MLSSTHFTSLAFLVSLLLCSTLIHTASALGPDGPLRRKGKEDWKHEDEDEDEHKHEHEHEEEEGTGGEEMRFLLGEAKRVMSTDAGEMRVVKGYNGKRRFGERGIHVGFITMEPRSLFLPQYLDSDLLLFVRRGEAKIGLIYKDELVERRLRIGDIYRVPAGSSFYIVNVGEGQRLHVICSIDPSRGLGVGTFQSFFVAGGANPASVLAGFDQQTLSTAFNVTIDELREIMTGQEAGPIVYIDSRGPRVWSDFLELKDEKKMQQLKELMPDEDQQLEEQDQWSLKKMLTTLLLGIGDNRREGGDGGSRKTGGGPDAYNIFDRKPDFRNNYGWSLALDHHEYHPLKKSGLGVYYVNLSAGSMMAPHLNPTAAEYGIVLHGTGTIQIVYPNGTSALNTKVREGTVFWVPRYFPFCQIASRSGPFEFFGFTTSSHRNRPQFLVGANSILQTMRGSEFAAAFGLTTERFREIVDAQRESVIIPTPAAAPPDEEVKSA